MHNVGASLPRQCRLVQWHLSRQLPLFTPPWAAEFHTPIDRYQLKHFEEMSGEPMRNTFWKYRLLYAMTTVQQNLLLYSCWHC